MRLLPHLASSCVFLLAACTTVESAAPNITLSKKDAETIGRKIWKNECAGTIEGLTSWNTGEDFASLGIGHFIWYPAGKNGPFDESFPKLLAAYEARGIPLPNGLTSRSDCPWPTRAAFKAAFHSAQMKNLRKLLANTIAIQTEVVVARLEAALPKMLAASPAPRRAHIEHQFATMSRSTRGLFAMIDYVNFKGEGISPTERYQGQGWGLLQVLDGMPARTNNPVDAFSDSAKRTLSRRVKNAPPARKESRWLKGWHNRLDTY